MDCCPRCGESFEGYPDEDTQRQHLVDCMDDKKHAAFAAKRENEKKIKHAKDLLQSKQESVQSKATWDFLGGQTSQLGIIVTDTTSDKNTLIAQIASRKFEMEAQSSSSGSGNHLLIKDCSSKGGSKRKR